MQCAGSILGQVTGIYFDETHTVCEFLSIASITREDS